eukprot:13139383-Alexandrium_andersonii.AAC.1
MQALAPTLFGGMRGGRAQAPHRNVEPVRPGEGSQAGWHTREVGPRSASLPTRTPTGSLRDCPRTS